jgi:hypothetical protein
MFDIGMIYILVSLTDIINSSYSSSLKVFLLNFLASLPPLSVRSFNLSRR